MEFILIFLLIIVAVGLLALVLLQHGKGADIGAAFGSGASNTVFGSQGAAPFLMKLTIAFGAIFFVICIVLTNLSSRVLRENVIISTYQKKTAIPIVPTSSSVAQEKKYSVTNNNVPQVPPASKK